MEHTLEKFDGKQVNMIRGKSLLMPEDAKKDIQYLCRMIDWFESILDDADENDMFGTEGWRHHFRCDEP